MQAGRKLLMAKRQGGFDQSRYTSSCVQMTDVGFD
jgi:hypothetical protein